MMNSFIFDSYQLLSDRRTVLFRYLVSGHIFTEKLYLPQAVSNTASESFEKTWLFNLHLALGVSYWKIYCPKEIQIRSGSLSEDQALFWNTVYSKGLGEFFFRNQLSGVDNISFPYTHSSFSPVSFPASETELVGIGGGKDSLLSWELLKKQGKDLMGFLIETNRSYPSIHKVASIGNIPLIIVRRTIDPTLEHPLNGGKAFNGHVPISMIYAWIGVFVAAVYGYRAFVASNEKSANEGNVVWNGKMINHQWSKSQEFETFFNRYITSFVCSSCSYYSPLRSYSELEIVRQFVEYKQYLAYVSSCNRNFSITNPLIGENRWCNRCAKCVFAFLLFAACLPRHTVVKMFGTNLFQEKGLEKLFFDIVGKGKMKPFDCVGTFEEAQEAVRLILRKKEFPDSPILKALQNTNI